METLNPAAGAPRQVWLDVSRLVAMFLLVCCHCADPFNFYSGHDPETLARIQFWGGAWGSLIRPCVPLFVMITGSLLLPLRRETGPFLRRYLPRIIWPFVIWSAIYYLFPWLLSLLGGGPEMLGVFFPYAASEPATLSAALDRIVRIPLNFNPLAVQMWYIYLLVGLYLYQPVFSAWVEKASLRAKLWFLGVWGVTLLLPYYRHFVDGQLWGECAWNDFGMLYYFCGFNGYLLLGHVLRHHVLPWRTVLLWGVPMFVAGYLLTFFGFNYTRTLSNVTGDLDILELFWTYCSLSVVLMSAPLFALMSHLNPRSERVQLLLKNLTTCGFGIFMIHYFFIGPSVQLMRTLGVPMGLQIPLAAVVAFAASWLVVDGVRRLLGARASLVVLGAR